MTIIEWSNVFGECLANSSIISPLMLREEGITIELKVRPKKEHPNAPKPQQAYCQVHFDKQFLLAYLHRWIGNTQLSLLDDEVLVALIKESKSYVKKRKLEIDLNQVQIRKLHGHDVVRISELLGE